MTDDEKDKHNESLVVPLALGVLGGLIVVAEVWAEAVKPVVATVITAKPEPGSEEEGGGTGGGMSSFIGPGRTPQGWRDGANLFGG